MNYHIDQQTLEFLWEALNQKESLRPRFYLAINRFKKIKDKGWAFKSDLEDLVDCLDWRLATHRFSVRKFSEAFGIHWEPVCFRPKAVSRGVVEYDAIRVEDTALLLILLERVGFDTEPSEFVNLLLPGIKSRKKALFNNAELEIFWFMKTRHKNPNTRLISNNFTGDYEELGVLKTRGGYIITLQGDEHGAPMCLEIKSPKFRKQPKPVEVTCPDCGIDWYKGDPESSLSHRKIHKEIMSYLSPSPLPEMLEERKVSGEPELVTASSPKWKHQQMYQRARAFATELRFDIIQWANPDSTPDPDAYGYLFTDSAGAIVGACSFYDRSKEYGYKVFYLDWIWICRKERCNGHLTSRWKFFRERFGDFVVSSPVSDDMQCFLLKAGDSDLMRYPKSRI